jgi:Pseudouridylate synthase
MTRYKLTIAYDGTKFHGFQRQNDLRTVQGVMEKALTKMTKGQQVNVFGSGRTDAGVHALGQVIHFDYPGTIPAESMLRAINSLMPLDVLVKKSEIVDEEFHARFGVKKRLINIESIVDIIQILLSGFTQGIILTPCLWIRFKLP